MDDPSRNSRHGFESTYDSIFFLMFLYCNVPKSLFRITSVSNKFDNQYLFDQHLCFVKAYHQNLSNMQATRNSLLRIICKIRLFVLNNLQEFVFFVTIEMKYFLVVLRCCWHETWMLTKGSSCVSCFWCSWHKVSQGISDE